MTAPRALVTNDDGIDADGLRHLAGAALEEGLDVVIAAPARESSGSSAAIKAAEDSGRISTTAHELEGLDGVPTYAVRAAPALITLIARHGAFGDPPDVVLSGINRGANLGLAVLHSGTVGAALTAGVNGGLGLAVSLDVASRPEDPQWPTAARLAGRALRHVLRQPAGTVLNLNVPNVGHEDVPGLRPAELAPFGIVHTTMTEPDEGHVRLAVTDNDEPPVPGTDAALLAEGFATVTPLDWICAGDQSVLNGLTELPQTADQR